MVELGRSSSERWAWAWAAGVGRAEQGRAGQDGDELGRASNAGLGRLFFGVWPRWRAAEGHNNAADKTLAGAVSEV